MFYIRKRRCFSPALVCFFPREMVLTVTGAADKQILQKMRV